MSRSTLTKKCKICGVKLAYLEILVRCLRSSTWRNQGRQTTGSLASFSSPVGTRPCDDARAEKMSLIKTTMVTKSMRLSFVEAEGVRDQMAFDEPE